MTKDNDNYSDSDNYNNNNQNTKVYMEIGTKRKSIGKIIIKLYNNIAPRTTHNFLALITGEFGYGYRGCNLHRIIPNFMIQGGDFTRGDGTGGHSIYGETFEDETFRVKHNKPGLLSMANKGQNTNGSQFFITLTETPWLDDKHVVFGEVVEGFDVIKEIEKYGSQDGKTRENIKIIRCGEL